MTELFANDAETTLAASIGSPSATTCLVTSAAGFPPASPSNGQFRILVDAEIMIVTNVSGNTFTITRGAEGTTAVAHANGADVAHVFTKGALAQFALDVAAQAVPTLSSIGLRLTLTTGTPVTTGDVTGAGTVYLTPMRSGQIALYVSGSWALRTTAEISLALVVTSGKNYDVFAYDNAGVVTLELSAAWATDTARTDALAQQDGVWVKAADHARRYLGTLRASGSNTTEDSASNRLLYNFYNQQPRALLVTDSTSSWAYTAAAWRAAQNAAAAHSWTYVTGMPYELVEAEVDACESASGGGANMSVGVGVDSTTVNSATLYGSTGQSGGGLPTRALYRGSPGLGFHTITWLEWGAGGGQFYGNVNSLGSQIAGMSGEVMA